MTGPEFDLDASESEDRSFRTPEPETLTRIGEPDSAGNRGIDGLNEYEMQQQRRRLDDVVNTPTGDDGVDEALATLVNSTSDSVRVQIQAVETVHAVLQDRLSDVEE